MKSFLDLFRGENKDLITKNKLSKILGFAPKRMDYYKLAFIDPSRHDKNDTMKIGTNDRLEFLGDSVLEVMVSKFLYEKYPDWPVGKLSQLRAHMVSRTVSNKIAEELHLEQFFLPLSNGSYSKDAYGNALEALIGAVYLDKGDRYVARFLREKLLPLYRKQKEEDENFGHNFKGEIQAWTDKHGKRLTYLTREDKYGKNGFKCELYIDGAKLGVGRGRSKKSAETEAARQALKTISLRKGNNGDRF